MPDATADAAAALAEELGISRNDALLRLAARGAHLYEQERQIARRRTQRWAAIAAPDDLAALPSAEEARAAILAARGLD